MGQPVGSMRTSAWTVLAAVIAVCVAICAADLAASSDEVAFLQTQQEMGTVRGHCEICIAVMQAKERGEPHLCASFRHPTSCTGFENGCIHNDPSQGPELVKPCPAHAVCGWVGNLYAKHPGEPFCPSDYRYRAP